MFKNLTDNAKNLAANAKIEDMSRLFKNHMSGKQDVKNAISGVMDISKEVSHQQTRLAVRNTNAIASIHFIATEHAASGKEFVTETVCRFRCSA